MTEKTSEQDFLAAVRSSLRDSEDGIDELTQARLRAARHRAVAAQQRWTISRVLALDWLFDHRKLVAAAMSLTIAAALLVSLNLQPSRQMATPMLEDIELLSSSDDLELYQDLDFYIWIQDDEITG
jgi:hypothetical protein